MTMSKEDLEKYLHNRPLIQAIEQKREVDNIKKQLLNSSALMRGIGISEAAIKEVQDKYEEYKNISKGYGNLLEDVWRITWQKESFILKFVDYSNDGIDKLPEYVSDL